MKDVNFTNANLISSVLDKAGALSNSFHSDLFGFYVDISFPLIASLCTLVLIIHSFLFRRYNRSRLHRCPLGTKRYGEAMQPGCWGQLANWGRHQV